MKTRDNKEHPVGKGLFCLSSPPPPLNGYSAIIYSRSLADGNKVSSNSSDLAIPYMNLITDHLNYNYDCQNTCNLKAYTICLQKKSVFFSFSICYKKKIIKTGKVFFFVLLFFFPFPGPHPLFFQPSFQISKSFIGVGNSCSLAIIILV